MKEDEHNKENKQKMFSKKKDRYVALIKSLWLISKHKSVFIVWLLCCRVYRAFVASLQRDKNESDWMANKYYTRQNMQLATHCIINIKNLINVCYNKGDVVQYLFFNLKASWTAFVDYKSHCRRGFDSQVTKLKLNFNKNDIFSFQLKF